MFLFKIICLFFKQGYYFSATHSFLKDSFFFNFFLFSFYSWRKCLVYFWSWTCCKQQHVQLQVDENYLTFQRRSQFGEQPKMKIWWCQNEIVTDFFRLLSVDTAYWSQCSLTLLIQKRVLLLGFIQIIGGYQL